MLNEKALEAACVGYWPLHWPDKFSEPDITNIKNNMRKAITAYLSAITPDEPRQWKPIETAPKDGTVVLLWCPGIESVEMGSFRIDGGYSGDNEPRWLDNSYDDYSTGYASNPLYPTHWMPLPAAPAQEGEV